MYLQSVSFSHDETTQLPSCWETRTSPSHGASAMAVDDLVIAGHQLTCCRPSLPDHQLTCCRPSLPGHQLKAPSHLDVWRKRVNIVWGNHQHVQKRTCVPVNHRLACSKHVSNFSKTTYHCVNTVWVTFSQRFHSVCERVPTCQTSVQRVLNVFVTRE